MSLRDTYAYAISVAKGKFDGSAQEKDGKLHFEGSVKTEAQKNEIGRPSRPFPAGRTTSSRTLRSAAAESAAAYMNAPAHRYAPARTYTVKAGDTLSAIAKAQLGSASEYMKIFEANRDQLSDPDKIKPVRCSTSRRFPRRR